MSDDKKAEAHQDPFDPNTPNDPMVVGGRRMMGSTFQDNVTVGTKFLRSNMGESHFYQTNLDGSTFDDVGIRNSTLNNISLGNSKITNSCLTNLEIDGNLTGMVIQGIPLKDLFDAYEQVTGKKVDR